MSTDAPYEAFAYAFRCIVFAALLDTDDMLPGIF